MMKQLGILVLVAVGCSAADSTPTTTKKTSTSSSSSSSSSSGTVEMFAGFTTASAACQQCLPSAYDGNGPCAPDSTACKGSQACLDSVACFQACTGAADTMTRFNCVAMCLGNSKDTAEAYKPYLSCLCCSSPCAGTCKDICVLYENAQAGPAFCP